MPDPVRPAARGDIELVDVRKSYGSTVAVAGVSLHVRGGEFLALLGPSGSGKTTILNLVAGFERLTSGAIRVDGQEISAVPPYRRGIGIVFQHYALFPHMTVAENVAFPLRMRHASAAEQRDRVAEALELVRLAGYEGRYPKELSGGQQQRVALARAIVFRPAVLLMDEPLGALDRKLRQHMQVELRMLQRRLETTVVYVTHDQEEALTMADRVAVVWNGLLQQVGSPEDLYERPANPFVADFVGESNFLSGTIAAADGHAVQVDLGPGVRVAGMTREDLPAVPIGARVRLAVRPERIAVARPSADAPPGLPARLLETLYLGASTLYVLETAFGTLSARVPVTQATESFALGDDAVLRWRSRDARVYLEEGADGVT